MKKMPDLHDASAYRVPFDSKFNLSESPQTPDFTLPGKKQLQSDLKKCVKRISQLQRKLYADNRYSLLLVFQAMDAAGKDGTIRAVMSGVNPAGCVVSSFKAPSNEELEHDFLWRTACRLPERGIIGIFNRSYYEEVLAVKVRPEYLAGQRLPPIDHDRIWQDRYASIREHESHLARNGTVILKFWLNVSREEQKNRFLDRLNDPDKYWKFSKTDLSERGKWSDYMDAYELALNATSRPEAPWFAIPADNKPYMRLVVARQILSTLEQLPLAYPEKNPEEIQRFNDYKEILHQE